MPLRSYHTAIRVLPPQSHESNDVLDNRDGSEQSRADTEDGVGRKLIARQAVPHSKVQANGHAHAVEYDQQPEPKDGLLPGAQRVVQRRRLVEVDVGEDNLCVREGCIPERGCMAGIAARRWGRGSCARGVLVGGAIDAHGLARDHERRCGLGV
jgi:hypothetical protein